MNNQQKKEYLDSGGCQCPHCFSFNMLYGIPKLIGPHIEVEVECECGKSWVDIYMVVNVKSENKKGSVS